MATMTGAQLIIHLLERQGVQRIAGIPGGANLPLYDALYSSQQIRHVLARHEQGAGFIAQGMARVTGQPAVCFATSGPGATNILTATEEKVNLKIILMNNNSLGLVHQQQDLFYGQRIFASDFRTQVDFLTIARGFGMAAYELGQGEAAVATLSHALRLDGPCLIHAPLDAGEKVYPMVPPGAANHDMIGDEIDVYAHA